MELKEFKQLLRELDYKGDRWGVSMGAFFDLCAIAYERIDLPADWQYRHGMFGNIIEDENIFKEFELSDDQILTIGNYLLKLTSILRNTDYAY